ncbi:YceD family protein [Limoniibacter endophyticus]|uniref:Metal-binding protein n=1 Tax=Limoniibacter endophyticus TaxID=1565040 RepID=A0A8J3DSG9_9HYPH|nr:DUF177 domain-containing protein [Limoniibacter endophyticus]GHC79736.1 metal-binding protein [Limoniibacter endophyticus]
MNETEKSPIHYDVDVVRLPSKGIRVRIEADEAQRTALAKIHELISVDSFYAEMVVTQWKKKGAKVSGRFSARIVQECVVTLEPLETLLEDDFEGLFVPENSPLSRPASIVDGEMLLDAEGPDAPEEFAGTTVDVGAFAEENFVLAIDPYPRKEGAEVQQEVEELREESPFAKLAALKTKAQDK